MLLAFRKVLESRGVICNQESGNAVVLIETVTCNRQHVTHYYQQCGVAVPRSPAFDLNLESESFFCCSVFDFCSN